MKKYFKYAIPSGSVLLLLQFIITKIMEINMSFLKQVFVYTLILVVINIIIFYLLRDKKDKAQFYYVPKFLRNIFKRKLIKKEAVKTKSVYRNNPDHFIEINIEALRAYLIGWNESYKSIIKKVVLYNNSHAKKISMGVKYILYFDLEYNRETESTRTIFKEFIDIDKKLPIIGDEFKNIYKKTVPSNHLDEWHLTVEKPEGVNEEFSYVLYP